uniref:Uncharacterized protein n=1 Tax=Rhizophora mucronata TaxID=61149 RepID=A0A2P2PL02_RHIMU
MVLATSLCFELHLTQIHQSN